MSDDIEGDIPESDDSPASSEPSPEPADTESAVREAIRAQRERGPDGKFVAKQESKSEAKADAPGNRGAARGVATGLPDTGAKEGGTKTGDGAVEHPDTGQPPRTATNPPPGFSIATKQAWDALPEHVKSDIAKREGEIETGLKRYSGLKNFAEEAERNGTTIQNAVSDFVAVEQELRKDPVRGVEFLFQKMGVNPLAVLNGWVKKYMAMQGGQPQSQPQPQIDPNEIVARATNAVRTEFQQKQIDSDIATFSANPANRFFGNVRQDMAHLVQAGKAADLQTAYEAACWLHPEIRAILIEEMKGGDKGAVRTAARAQNAAKGVVGAPSSNSHDEPPKKRYQSTEEAVRAAIAAQRGV